MSKKNEKEKKKKPVGMSSKNLKEHRSFYKWIKHYGAILDEYNNKLKKLMARSELMKVVAVCGGFDPLHIGHISHFREAKMGGDFLVVFLQTDDWLIKKKGYIFMSFEERKEIIESIRYVDKVTPVIDTDMSVAKTLEKYIPDVFAKGGDRKIDNMPKSEIDVCIRLGIKIIYGVGGGKVQSSSWLVDKMRSLNAEKS